VWGGTSGGGGGGGEGFGGVGTVLRSERAFALGGFLEAIMTKLMPQKELRFPENFPPVQAAHV